MSHLLRQQFTEETGSPALFRKGVCDYHTVPYVKWLEAKVEKLTPTNTPKATICPACKGKKVIELKPESLCGAISMSTVVKCSLCNGTGKQ